MISVISFDNEVEEQYPVNTLVGHERFEDLKRKTSALGWTVNFKTFSAL